MHDCRHTFATWAIAAGVRLFYLSRIMGTSITQIDYDAEVLPLAVEHAL